MKREGWMKWEGWSVESCGREIMGKKWRKKKTFKNDT